MLDFLSRRSRAPAAARAVGERVSVVVPLYNHERYIAEALASALDQGPQLCEVVVVDDGSADGSAAIVEKLAAKDPRVVFWSGPNRGAHAAINAGILRCRGEFVAILNSDDVFEPGRCERLVGVMDREPACDLVASGISFIDDRSQPAENAWYDQALGEFKRTGDLGLALVNGNFVMTTSNFLFRRTLIERIGLFKAFRYAHDVDYLLRAIARGHIVRFHDEPLLRYRRHGSNTIGEDHRRVRAEWVLTTALFLDAITAGGEPDWGRLVRAEDILQRHELTRGVHLCLAYLRAGAGHPARAEAMLEDGPFIETLRTCV